MSKETMAYSPFTATSLDDIASYLEAEAKQKHAAGAQARLKKDQHQFYGEAAGILWCVSVLRRTTIVPPEEE
jgi:hypothetical protein